MVGECRPHRIRTPHVALARQLLSKRLTTAVRFAPRVFERIGRGEQRGVQRRARHGPCDTSVPSPSSKGGHLDRRRIELQLRLVRALYRAETIRRDARARAIFIERAEPILASTEAAIGTDDDLKSLLHSVRREISGRD